MRTTRKLFWFLCLAFVSLACLTTTEPFVTYPADTPTAITATVTPTATPSAKAEPGCAVVKADESLHLRKYAGVASQVLAYLKSGEVVELISDTNKDWWRIKSGDLVGYARSKYLEKSEC